MDSQRATDNAGGSSRREVEASSAAPELWVERYADVLFRYAMSRVGRTELAEDMVQETLLAALQAHQSFRGDSQQQTWLIGILRHKVVDHFRSARRNRTTSMDSAEGDVMESWFDEKGRLRTPPSNWAPDAGQLLENQEFWQVFHRCLDNLPDRPREVFALRMMEDQSTEFICKELDVTATNLWVILHRARSLLRACLEKHWFGRGDAEAE